jgi:hypothetical protein
MDKVLALQAIKNAGISISPGTSKSALTFEMLKDVQGFLRAWRRDITLPNRVQPVKHLSTSRHPNILSHLLRVLLREMRVALRYRHRVT